MKTFTYQFEKLEVWKLSQALIKQTYSIARDFPKEERYNLTDQLKRAALSITANIAEGTGRSSKMDRAHFINMSFSSALECMSHMITAKVLGFIDQETLDNYRIAVNHLTNKLNSFYKYQLRQGDSLKHREGTK